MKERDRYLKIVEWSEEDQCYVGSVPGWIGRCCHGADEEQLYDELCRIVDEWIETYRQDERLLPAATAGREYSGKLQLRPGPELHQALALQAMQEGESLNAFCPRILKKAVTSSPA